MSRARLPAVVRAAALIPTWRRVLACGRWRTYFAFFSPHSLACGVMAVGGCREGVACVFAHGRLVCGGDIRVGGFLVCGGVGRTLSFSSPAVRVWWYCCRHANLWPRWRAHDTAESVDHNLAVYVHYCQYSRWVFVDSSPQVHSFTILFLVKFRRLYLILQSVQTEHTGYWCNRFANLLNAFFSYSL
ncbi:hypothetical protein C8R44DRAFT_226941 [Mycena epipterygia]|nr:hypothetical protein C8R44DRAFT_226941 [Mycena epipterygia]